MKKPEPITTHITRPYVLRHDNGKYLVGFVQGQHVLLSAELPRAWRWSDANQALAIRGEIARFDKRTARHLEPVVRPE